jgi:hypothetical protein
VPGRLVKGHKLGYPTAAIDEQVRGNPHSGQIREGAIRSRIQAILKQRFDHAGAKSARRQRDIVNYQQGDVSRIRTRSAVFGRASSNTRQPMVFEHLHRDNCA